MINNLAIAEYSVDKISFLNGNFAINKETNSLLNIRMGGGMFHLNTTLFNQIVMCSLDQTNKMYFDTANQKISNNT